MTKNNIGTTGELEIPFPGKKFDGYLRRFNTSEKFLGYKWQQDNLKKIFLLVVFDFKRGEISLDELSSIGGYLWGKMGGYLWMVSEPRRSSELRDVLEAAGELNFYVRAVEDQVCSDTFVYFLRKVLSYFGKYKSEVEGY